jgi:hypothetical protein
MLTKNKYLRRITGSVLNLPFSVKAVNISVNPLIASNKYLRWTVILLRILSFILMIASSYFGIIGFLDTSIGNEVLKGILSFCLVFLFIWGANQLVFTEWAKDPRACDFD